MEKIYNVLVDDSVNLELVSYDIIDKVYKDGEWGYKIAVVCKDGRTRYTTLWDNDFTYHYAFNAKTAILKYIMFVNNEINTIVAEGKESVEFYNKDISRYIKRIKKAKELLDKYM